MDVFPSPRANANAHFCLRYTRTVPMQGSQKVYEKCAEKRCSGTEAVVHLPGRYNFPGIGQDGTLSRKQWIVLFVS